MSTWGEIYEELCKQPRKLEPYFEARKKFTQGKLTEEDLAKLTDDEVWGLANTRNGIHPLFSPKTSREEARKMLLDGRLYKMYIEEREYLKAGYLY